MNTTKSLLISVTCMLAAACASAPKTHVLVPSRSTVPELKKLSHQPGTTVDVLTVNREERRLLLDAGDGAALTGHDLDVAPQATGADSAVRVPFDDLALVYYSTGRRLDRDGYPSLPNVGATEQRLSCDELAVDLARAETIRWYARRQGAVPFSAHEATKQHEMNAVAGTVKTLIVVAMVVGGGGGAGLDGTSVLYEHDHAKELRWAVTAADRRIIGLLKLRRARGCAVQQIKSGTESDLAILGQIEELRQAPVTKSTSGRDQRDLQTSLLDRFDPMLASTGRADFAGALQAHDKVQ